ncbi:RNase H family protein [Intestinibacter sp.]|uniref:RNase H family protein n=1 Tax=Intestinibacter sp. TaxID=1965304 RepID=UPI003F168E09
MNYKLFTDGAYSSSRDKGGIGILFVRDNKIVLTYSKGFYHTTNNKMELIAIIAGLKCIAKPIDSLVIVSDSMYCIGIITQNWKRRKNIELWKRFDKELERVKKLCPDISFVHTRGHQTDNSDYTKYNNMCDKLAATASL